MAGGFGFARPKPGSKLSTRIDADGREVEVEVREDEEQEVKLQEIIDLLLAAGYFRARIKGLSPFDKVVGGMTWCIETCNFDVDIDLLFQENLTIGQKIALTEKIVAVLPRMKCPHRIEPHQIQGLDFIHIFPVVQWLVKRAIETREEMGDFIRSYSVSQFNKHYSLPEDNMQLSTQEKALASIRTIKKAYHPQRKFRMKDAPPSEEEPRVRCTLLEYGYSVAQSSVSNEAVEGSGEQSNSQKTPEMQDTQKAEELQIQALLKNMSLMEEQEGRLTAGVVGNLVNLKADEIVRAAEHYAELQAELEESSAVGGSQTHARLMSTLQKQKAALEEKEMQLVSEKERLQEAVSKSQDNLQDVKKSRQKIEQGLSELQTMETEENQGILKRLQALVVMNESLKQQEQQFREQCKVELSKLQNQVKDAEANATPDEDNEIISQQYESVRARLQQQRLLLAKRTRSIAGLQRQLDEVPGRAELAQYQRRFMELYNQVAAKHKETKQFYTLYNTLDDTKLYLSKELTLLNSILDNYTEAMAQPASREQFMKQFDAIVEGIKQNKSKVEHRRQEERLRRDRLSQQLLGLVEQQRRYVAAVRQLTIECRKNEVLLAQLRGT